MSPIIKFSNDLLDVASVISLNVTVSYIIKKLFHERQTPKTFEICPGLNANEIQIPYDRHHKVSSLVKSHQTTHNGVKYEVI